MVDAGVESAPTVERMAPEQSVKLGQLGRGLIEGEARKRDVFAKSPDSLNGAERKLRLVEAFRNGINPDTGEALSGVNLRGGKLLTLQKEYAIPKADGTKVDSLCVARIKEVNADGDYEVFFAPVAADGTAGDIIYDDDGSEITGTMSKADLADLQASNEAEDLATLFDGENQRAFTVYADSRREGRNYVPPNDLDTLIDTVAGNEGITIDLTAGMAPSDERKATPIEVFIAEQIKTIQHDIDDLPENSSQSDQLRMLLKDLKIAALAKGSVGVIYRVDAFGRLKDALDKKLMQATTSGDTGLSASLEGQMAVLDMHVGEMTPKIEGADGEVGAKDELRDVIEKSELKDKEALLAKIENNEAVSVLANESVLKLGGVSELVFGRKNFDVNALNDLVHDPHIDGAKREQIVSIVKKSGSITGVTLLAILMGLAEAAVMALQAAGSTNRR